MPLPYLQPLSLLYYDHFANKLLKIHYLKPLLQIVFLNFFFSNLKKVKRILTKIRVGKINLPIPNKVVLGIE
jgi:hypothetical protein